ncbi:hypothetical protein BK129_30495 [Paenibacillus amylolyticus]|nr:hypothetical protein BK129_30495 [Paenibacillus amylolyticus]
MHVKLMTMYQPRNGVHMKILLWTDNLSFLAYVQSLFNGASIITVSSKDDLQKIHLGEIEKIILHLSMVRKEHELQYLINLYLGAIADIYLYYDSTNCVDKTFSILGKIGINVQKNVLLNTKKSIYASKLHLDFDRKAVLKNNKCIDLSSREYQVLQFLINHCNSVVYTTELLKSVWKGFGCEANVYMTIQKIRKKIEENPKKPKYLLTRNGGGYILKL